MARYSLLLAFALMTGCASAPKHEWRSEDTRRELYFAAALAADAYTTAHFGNDPTAREQLGIARSIYGSQPDAESVLVTAAVGGLLHWLLAKRIDHFWRPYWQFGFTFMHGNAAINNCRFVEDVGC